MELKLKNFRDTTIDAISYVALAAIVIGAILVVVGLFMALRNTYEHPRTFLPLIEGLASLISGFLMIGFRYIVEAAVLYITQMEFKSKE